MSGDSDLLTTRKVECPVCGKTVTTRPGSYAVYVHGSYGHDYRGYGPTGQCTGDPEALMTAELREAGLDVRPDAPGYVSHGPEPMPWREQVAPFRHYQRVRATYPPELVRVFISWLLYYREVNTYARWSLFSGIPEKLLRDSVSRMDLPFPYLADGKP